MPSNTTNREGFVYIKDIILSFLGSKGATTLHGFVRLLSWAIKGYNELNFSLALEPRTAYVKLDFLKRVNLLSLKGFRSLVKVGVLRGDRIVVFIPDSSIAKIFKRTTQPFNQTNTSYVDSFNTTGEDTWYEILMTNYIDASGNLRIIRGFGTGHNGIGYFNYDRQTQQLLFSAEVPDEHVYIEYIKDVYEVGSKTMVPVIVADYLEEYLNWREARQKFGDAARETEARAVNMKNALFNVIMRTDNLSLESILDIVVRGVSRMQ